MSTPSRQWLSQSVCVDADELDVFFNEDRWKAERPELEFCAHCPVAYECLYYGGVGDGIYGGMRPEERRRFLNHHVTGSGRELKAWTKHMADLKKRAAGRQAVMVYDAGRAAKKAG